MQFRVQGLGFRWLEPGFVRILELLVLHRVGALRASSIASTM